MIAQRFRWARYTANLTLKELSLKTGYSVTSIHNIELCKNLHPDIRLCSALANGLKQDLVYLCDFDKLPNNTLPEQLYKARMYRGLPPIEAAEWLNIHVQTYRCWEAGKSIPDPSYQSSVNDFIKIIF